MPNLEAWVTAAADWIWGLPLLLLISGGGLYFLVRSRFVPYRHFGHALAVLTGKHDDPNAPGAVDSYTGAPGDSLFTSANLWGGHADGGVLGPLDGTSWAMDARFTDLVDGPGNEMNGLTSWAAHSSDGSSIDLALELDRPVRIEMTLPCIADIDRSNAVSVTDLLALLAAWGPCPECPEDLDGDGLVSVTDLLMLLARWGACP